MISSTFQQETIDELHINFLELDVSISYKCIHYTLTYVKLKFLSAMFYLSSWLGQWSAVRGQRSEVSSQRSEVRDQRVFRLIPLSISNQQQTTNKQKTNDKHTTNIQPAYELTKGLSKTL